MANETKTPKSGGNSIRGQVRDGHSVGRGVRAWQPTTDTAGTPPKKSSSSKKK